MPNHSVYFLRGRHKTYIGYTTNIMRRLRQHRGEIVGGAKYTKTMKDIELIATISGFPSASSAMSYEWHAKRKFRWSQLNGFPLSNVEKRFLGFFRASSLPKFEPVKSKLCVTLYEYHNIASCVKSLYGLDCRTETY